MPTVFLSHAAADKALVDDLKQLIQTAVGLAPGEFFYSSGRGTGIPPGQNFVEYIREEMEGATLVISVISPAFRESEFCLAELGAVWVAADKDFFPLCTPDVDRGGLNATLTGIQVERIDDAATLAGLLQGICTHFGREYNAAACSEAIEVFRATLPTRLEGLAGATRVPAEDLQQANDTIARLGEQLTTARDEIQAHEARFEALKAARTDEEIREVSVPDDVREAVEYLLKEAKEAARKLPHDVREVLPYALSGEGMPWPDGGAWERADIEKQVAKGFLVDGDDGRVYPNTDWPDVDDALGALRALQDCLRGLDGEDERWFKEAYRVPADLSQTAAFDELI